MVLQFKLFKDFLGDYILSICTIIKLRWNISVGMLSFIA